MSDKQTIILDSSVSRALAHRAIEQAPEGYVSIIQEMTRTIEQNAKLHCMLTDIKKQVVWYGQKFSIEVWKRLCVAAWLREKNESPMLIPSLDGNGVDIIYEKTSRLSVSQCSELIEWCYAFGANNGVKFRETRYEGYPTETRMREVLYDQG